MKNLLLVAIATLFTTSVFSQNLPVPTKWKIKKFGITVGSDMDMIKGMDGNYLISTAKDITATLPDGISLDSDMYGGVCENPHLRITAALEVPGMRNMELQLGANAFFNRLDGAYYHDEGYYNADLGYFDYQYLSVNSINHELGLEGALVKRMSIGNVLNFYAGAGTNLGYSFGGDLTIDGSNLQSVNQNMGRSTSDIVTGTTYNNYNYHTFDAKDAFHQRVFLQTGVGIVFLKRLEIGLEYRGGLGYKATIDGPTKRTKLQSVGFSAKWLLK